MVNSLLTWSHSRGWKLTFRIQEKAAAVKKVLDLRIRNGDYKYTRVFFPAVDTRGRRFRTLRSLVKWQIQRVCVSMLSTISYPFFLSDVEKAMLKYEDLFGFENCSSAISECASRKVQDSWKLIVFIKIFLLCTGNVLLLSFINPSYQSLTTFDSLAAF